MLWPSAARAWELLSGAKIGPDAHQHPTASPERHKRDADDAFGHEKNSDYLQREAFSSTGGEQQPIFPQGNDPGVQDLSTRIMAHMLGLDVPGIEPSTSFYPGYEWWPRTNPGQGHSQLSSNQGTPLLHGASDTSIMAAPMTDYDVRNNDAWLQSGAANPGYSFDYNSYGL